MKASGSCIALGTLAVYHSAVFVIDALYVKTMISIANTVYTYYTSLFCCCLRINTILPSTYADRFERNLTNCLDLILT